MVTFAHPHSGSALSAPNGRWLVAATDVNDGSFTPGSLVYDFKRYNAAPGDAAVATDVGNGLLFSVPEFATVTGTVQVKTYDATAAATSPTLPPRAPRWISRSGRPASAEPTSTPRTPAPTKTSR